MVEAAAVASVIGMDPWRVLAAADPVEVVVQQAVINRTVDLLNEREEQRARMTARLVAMALAGKAV